MTVGAHGTWVASIAAGSNRAGYTGVAPGATLIGVQLDLPDEAWRATDLADVQGVTGAEPGCAGRWRSYDESKAIIDALQSAVSAALALGPDGIVLNLSIGAWAGSHHASAAVNRAISEIAALNELPDGPAVFVVAGMGNSGDDRGHFSATIAPGATRSFTWHLAHDRSGAEKLEIWSDQPISVRLRAARRLLDDRAVLLLDSTGPKQLFIDGVLVGVGERVEGPCPGLYCAHFLIMPERLPAGAGAGETIQFKLDVECLGARPGEVHAWIERDCSGRGSYLEPAHRASTLTSLASAPGVVAVAGLDGCDHSPPRVLAMSGRGPAPWARRTGPRRTGAGIAPADAAPALAAPAAGIWGACSKTKGFMRGSGTSAATAIASGATALAIEAAARNGARLSRPELMTFLVGRASSSWSPEFGWGPLAFAPIGHPHQSSPSRPAGHDTAPRPAAQSKPIEVEGHVAP